MQEINIYEIASWPDHILNYMDNSMELFSAWCDDSVPAGRRAMLARQFDNVVTKLRPNLENYYMIGYHCTRLVDAEIEDIRNFGMRLLNPHVLKARIEGLVDQGYIDEIIAESLIENNEADDPYRKEMLWFCLFHPYHVGEMGISRLLRSWGGEALFNSHEGHPVTGAVLRNIGTASIIEVKVPCISLPAPTFDLNFVNRYLAYKGLQDLNATLYETYINERIVKENLISIHRFPEESFVALTKCDTWDMPLSEGRP